MMLVVWGDGGAIGKYLVWKIRCEKAREDGLQDRALCRGGLSADELLY